VSAAASAGESSCESIWLDVIMPFARARCSRGASSGTELSNAALWKPEASE
jgi:hypothetical protein